MEELFGDLVAVFLTNSRRRIREMREAIELLVHGSSPEGLATLRRHFHGFAGLGETYGYAGVSDAGDRGEAAMIELIRAGDSADALALDRIRQLIDEIETLLTVPPGAPLDEITLPSARSTHDVLIVEDDEETRHALSVALQSWGAFVRVAATRLEALLEIDVQVPQIAIIDITLPDGEGYEVAAHLRSVASGNPIVAMVSARHGFIDRVEAIRCGSDMFFEKPVSPERIIRSLDELVERRGPAGARILAVEDDPEHVNRLRRILEGAGYEFHNCMDPLDLESLLIELEPELVIMDIDLQSDLDGYALSRFIRQNVRWSSVPIVFLTAADGAETSLEVTRAGGDDYLVKPVPSEVLLTTLAARIDRARVIRSLVDRDGLTGLLTRTAFVERAEAVIKSMSRQPGYESCLVLIDLDHFKKINDDWGHLVGDRVLSSFAGYLDGRLRQSDVIARYGGEEFALVIDHLDPRSTGRLMESILDGFAPRGPMVDAHPLSVTFSAGIVALEPTMTVERALELADQALYEAKRRGRATTVVADQKA